MIRLGSAALLLLLGACGGDDRPRPPPEPMTAQQAACLVEARSSQPALIAARQYNPSNASNVDRVDRELAVAVARAERDCLIRAGVVRKGGVEAVQR